jgi:hypothetical protein
MIVTNGKLIDFKSKELIMRFDGPVPAVGCMVVTGGKNTGLNEQKYYVHEVNLTIDNGRSKAEVFVAKYP